MPRIGGWISRLFLAGLISAAVATFAAAAAKAEQPTSTVELSSGRIPCEETGVSHCEHGILGGSSPLFGPITSVRLVVRRQPKTLFEWARSDEPCDDEESEDSDETWLEAEVDQIVTDRPDFTEASSTVGLNRIQVEAGYTFIRDISGPARHTFQLYPETLVRVGLFAEWFELRVAWTYLEEREEAIGLTHGRRGALDTLIGVKLALVEQDGFRPEMAVILQTFVPTGSPAFSADTLLPGVNLLYSWEINDWLSVGGSTQAIRFIEDPEVDDHRYLLFIQSMTVGYQLTHRLGAYTEWFGFFPHSALHSGIQPMHFLNGGITFLLTPLLQLDARIGFGLNRAAEDFFTGVGVAWKY